jgi:hypothetical protein
VFVTFLNYANKLKLSPYRVKREFRVIDNLYMCTCSKTCSKTLYYFNDDSLIYRVIGIY